MRRASVRLGSCVLIGCASTGEDGSLSAYGVSEAWSGSGPEVERYESGETVCRGGTQETPCVASYAGGWEPFAAAISATLNPIQRLITSGVALFLGRDDVPVEPIWTETAGGD